MKTKYLIGLALLLFLSIGLANATDFNITNTSQFDAGFKENATGNYRPETYTDNLNISEGGLSISNKYSDRFTFDDTDANTWKWVYYEDEGFSTCEGNIANGTLNFNVYSDAGGYAWVRLAIVRLTGSFDIQVNYSDFTADDDVYDVYSGIGVTTDTTDFWSSGYQISIFRDIQDTDANGIMEHMYTASEMVSVWTEQETNDTFGQMRIVRDYVDSDTCDYTWYYWNNTGGDWVQLETYSYDGDINYCNPAYVFLSHPNWYSGTGWANISFDDFNVTAGLLTPTSLTYRTQWSTWISEEIEKCYCEDIQNVTVSWENADDKNYISQFNIVNTYNNETYVTLDASEEVFNTWNSSSGSITITEDMISSGSFADVTGDFKIKMVLWKNNIGVNDKAVILTELSGVISETPCTSTTIVDYNIGFWLAMLVITSSIALIVIGWIRGSILLITAGFGMLMMGGLSLMGNGISEGLNMTYSNNTTIGNATSQSGTPLSQSTDMKFGLVLTILLLAVTIFITFLMPRSTKEQREMEGDINE